MLNENQARRLEVRFGRLLAEAADLRSELEERRHGAGGAESQIAAELAALIDEVNAGGRMAGIQIAPRETDLERRIGAWAAAWWSRILDCGPEHLTGLGPVRPEAAELLAPAIQAMAARLARIRSLASGGDGS
ncbi:MAG: hypothetical protein ACE5HF_09895 [Gemmatimonadota bacterium]